MGGPSPKVRAASNVPFAAVLDNGTKGLSVNVFFIDNDYDNVPHFKTFWITSSLLAH